MIAEDIEMKLEEMGVELIYPGELSDDGEDITFKYKTI